MQAAMYLRKSRAEENESLEQTLAAHKETLAAFAMRNDIEIVRVYEEVASGDSLFARPAMLELLEHLETYEAVLCMDIDRLGRGSMKEQGIIFERIKDAGVKIITPRKLYDLANDMDETMSEFQAFFARQELKMIKTRLRRGVMHSVSQGCYVSNAPYGYTQTRADKKPTLAIHEAEAEGVRLIFNWYAEGMGCQLIADKLHEMGFSPHRGEKFNRTSVAKILRNPVYIGKVVWNQKECRRPKRPGERHTIRHNPPEDWLVVDGLHPAIIDDDLFNEANRLLTSRAHPPYRVAGHLQNPMAGVLYCSQCGLSMVRRPYGKRAYQTEHIICITKGCVRSARMDYVEAALLNALTSELAKFRSAQSYNKKLLQHSEVALTNTQAEITKARKQLDNLHNLLEQGAYTIAVFTERKAILENRIQTLFRAEEQAQLDKETARQSAEILIPKIEHLLANYESAPPAEKNRLLKSVIRKALYYKDKESRGQDFLITIQSYTS